MMGDGWVKGILVRSRDLHVNKGTTLGQVDRKFENYAVASYADILLGSSRTNRALKIPFIAISSRWTQAHLRSLCSKSYVKLASPDVCLAQIDICTIEMILCRCILPGSAHCSHDCWPSALGVLGNINVTLRTSLIAYLVWSIALNLFSFLLEGVCSLYGASDRRIFIR